MLKIKKQDQFVVYIIKGSTIKKFLILDLVTGTGIYYAVKIMFSSVLIASVGSVIGTEGIKKISNFRKKPIKSSNQTLFLTKDSNAATESNWFRDTPSDLK